MEESTRKISLDSNYTEIDLGEVLKIFKQSKLRIISIVALFSVLALIYSFFLPNIYQSKALLSPVGEETSGINNAFQNYGGIASLAGISLLGQSSDKNSIKALDKLVSLSFFSDHILPNIFLPNLMAVRSWDPYTNEILYDEKKYNKEAQKWVRDFEYPRSQIPSAQESFEVFIERHLEINEDDDTGFITISIKHHSPLVAKKWTELIVNELNYFFRVKDKAEAQAAIDYLNLQIAQTSFAEIKEVIAQLMQQKTQQLALIEVSDFYVFEYIDPPALMEEKYGPNRFLIFFLGTMLGLIVGMFNALFRHYVMGKKSK